MMEKQRTIKDHFALSGKGLHTGLNLTVEFCPAPENYGYKIQRVDVPGEPVIDVVAENVAECQRSTVLSNGKEHVSTIEHGLAALYALGVDNCHIKVNGPEFPILEGSAQLYIENILRVGIVEQEAEKAYLVVDEAVEYRDAQSGSVLKIEPADEFSISVVVSFDGSSISDQHADLMHMADFPTEIAAARTFVFVRDIEPLLAAGLIKGGDLDNAIVLYERELPQERFDRIADAMKVPRMDAKQLGYINHRPLVWDNEPARHKLLDIIGDLSLVGKPLKGHVIAYRPGHRVNNQLARLIRQKIKN